MSSLPDYIYHLSYIGIFLWFAFIEQVTPVPEEVALITVGYTSMHTKLEPVVCGVIAIAGLLTADNLIFYLSLKSNKLVEKLTGKVNKHLADKIKMNFQKNAVKTLIVMALLPKLRFLSPVISAASGISWKLFLFINSLVTVFYVTVYMLIGIFFQKQLNAVLHELALWQHIIFVAIILTIAIFLIVKIKKIKEAS
ncbi:hypothetical protein FRZ67_00105 [Panacibacter ginsenosidivorans]|uniref:VTT domain-containing protein n=1 Tax=Panacibacter ginsenosidivorans TaxID=1813871 RepID=A0A5B8V4Z1_9BACT|nr:VTT domain-containing protein [Panacibacter ginsenosidivorans]QEC65781.1 hypothetical protein FRZ67_00105 [Panacibacter ginsenosidivorans]